MGWIEEGFREGYGWGGKGTRGGKLFGEKEGRVKGGRDEDLNEEVWMEDGLFGGGRGMLALWWKKWGMKGLRWMWERWLVG